MNFRGPIRLKDPEQRFTIFEEYEVDNTSSNSDSDSDGTQQGCSTTTTTTTKKTVTRLKHVYLGRYVASSARSRGVLDKYTLKKREYINTTSMDAELAFFTANLNLASRGKMFYDPFVGTGSLLVSCAHFGASCWGSDIDGRMVRGNTSGSGSSSGGGESGDVMMMRRREAAGMKKKNGEGKRKDVRSNFAQYGIEAEWMDGFVADLTHCPLRESKEKGGWLDGIVCDPPYGVREGLKVLGHKEGKDRANGEVVWIEGVAAHLRDAYVPPKKPYSLEAMLGDILAFAARMLVDDGRVSLWMPTANDAEEDMAIPSHEALELSSVCVQEFNKWSRRLLTYRRIPGIDVVHVGERRVVKGAEGTTADELNGFRKRYFQGFRSEVKPTVNGESNSAGKAGRIDLKPA